MQARPQFLSKSFSPPFPSALISALEPAAGLPTDLRTASRTSTSGSRPNTFPPLYSSYVTQSSEAIEKEYDDLEEIRQLKEKMLASTEKISIQQQMHYQRLDNLSFRNHSRNSDKDLLLEAEINNRQRAVEERMANLQAAERQKKLEEEQLLRRLQQSKDKYKEKEKKLQTRVEQIYWTSKHLETVQVEEQKQHDAERQQQFILRSLILSVERNETEERRIFKKFFLAAERKVQFHHINLAEAAWREITIKEYKEETENLKRHVREIIQQQDDRDRELLELEAAATATLERANLRQKKLASSLALWDLQNEETAARATMEELQQREFQGIQSEVTKRQQIHVIKMRQATKTLQLLTEPTARDVIVSKEVAEWETYVKEFHELTEMIVLKARVECLRQSTPQSKENRTPLNEPTQQMKGSA